MKRNEPVLLKRMGKMNPTSVEEFIALGGFDGIKKVVTEAKEKFLDELLKANLRGRGGAAYPAGRKWRQLYEMNETPKYIVCNADEGEPGTFKDRELLSKTPLSVIEGMVIAGYIFGSQRGYIYIRGEYRKIQKVFQEAIDNATKAGFLGKKIMGIEGFDYTITIISGAGAYVCGENSALLNSIEGKAGRPRVKPPHLAEVGLYLKPTLVNNVESFASIPIIAIEGGKAFIDYGGEDGGGTKLIAISGQAKNRGVYEVNLGEFSLREIVYGENFGGGTVNGENVKFIHLGGQSGPIAFPEQFDTTYAYQALWDHDLAIGSGAIVVLAESACLVDYIRKVIEFFVHESCGKCTPCRLGTTRILELITDLTEGRAKPGDVERLETAVNHVAKLSACGLGQSVDKALKSCLKYRREEFEAHINGKGCVAGTCKCTNGGSANVTFSR